MSSTPRTLKRLGVASVAACTLLATPYLGGIANAAHVTGVEFFAPFSNTEGVAAGAPVTTITSNTDGTDTHVHLLADAPAGTSTVEFSYALASAPTAFTAIGSPIAAAPYQTNFNTLSILNGTPIILRAQAKNSVGAVVSTDLENVTVDNSAAGVNITQPATAVGSTTSTIGKFNGKVIVRGTVSPGYAGNVTLEDITGLATGPAPSTPAAVTATPSDGAFSALVPVNAATASGNLIYINGRTVAPVTDDTEVATTYAQLVTTITASPNPINDRPGGPPTTLTVTVKDQSGAVMGDVKVELDLNQDGDSGDGGESQQQTNDNGVVTFTVAPQTPTPPATSATRNIDIIANQTQTAGFNSAEGDKKISVAQNTVTPTPTTAAITSIDLTPQATPPGSVASPFTSFPTGETSFAIDEEDPDVLLQLKDQSGQPFPPGTTVNYRVTFDPEGTGALDGPRRIDTGTPTGYATCTTSDNGAGTADDGACILPDTLIGADALTLGAATNEGTYLVEAYINRDADAAPTAGDVIAPPVTYTFDGASLVFDNGALSQTEAGTATTRSFTFKLDNGTPLDSRAVDLTLGGGSGTTPANGGAIFTATQPAGTTRTAERAAVAVTNAAGKGSVSVTDPTTLVDEDSNPATPNVQQQETIVLTADAQSSPDSATQTIEFIRGAAPAEIRVVGYTFPYGGNDATPGRPVTVQLNVDNLNNGTAADTGTDLSGQTVALATDHGYFTSRDNGTGSDDGITSPTQLIPATTPTADAPVGAYRRDAASKTLITSDGSGLAAGNIRFTLAIDRDAEFDNDGIVTAQVVATVGGVSRTITIVFSTDETASTPVAASAGDAGVTFNGEEPLNPAATNALEIVPASDAVTTNASSNDTNGQNFFVRGRDLFNNLIKVNFSSSVDVGSRTVGDGLTSYTGETTPDITTFTSLPTTVNTAPEQTQSQILTVTKSFATLTYTDSDAGTAGFQFSPAATTAGTTTVTDTQTITYYTPVASQFVYTFGTTPSNTVPVNTAVTTSVTVKDQRNNPVQGLSVQFIRSGPNDAAGNSQTGGTATRTTNAAGQAGTSYSSGTPGVATVTVIVTDGFGNELSRGVQNVTFTSGTPTPSLSHRLGTPTIAAGQFTKVVITGQPGRIVQLLVRGAASTNYTVIATRDLNSGGGWAPSVSPSTTSSYIVRYSDGSSTTAGKTLLVKAVQSLAVSKSGLTGQFAGLVKPSLAGRIVTVYYYVTGGHVQIACTTRVQVGGKYACNRAGFRAGQLIHAFAQTNADRFNAAGRSGVKDLQF